MYWNKKTQRQIRIGVSPHTLEKQEKRMSCSPFLEREVKCEKWWNLQENQKERCQLWYRDTLETETAIWNKSQILQTMTALSSFYAHSLQWQYTSFKQTKSPCMKNKLTSSLCIGVTKYLWLHATLVLPI